MYVKGGRARCYLACSPDEISASSFRPSSPLLPRSFSPSLPSSYAFFLFLFLLALPLRPTLLPLTADSLRSALSRKAKTFSAGAIVGLLIALGFPPSSNAFFSSYLNLSFSPLFFFSPSAPARVFRMSPLKLGSRTAISISPTSLALLPPSLRALFSSHESLFLHCCTRILLYFLSTYISLRLYLSRLAGLRSLLACSPLVNRRIHGNPALLVLVDHVDSHPIIIIHRQGAHRSHQQPSFRERLP